MKYRFNITNDDYLLAKDNMWKIDENVLIGNIGEIIACKYLQIEYSKHIKLNSDCGYDLYKNEIKYQVKCVKDEPYKRKLFLEKSNKNFDRYLLILISQDLDWAEIYIDSNKDIIENNALFDEQYKKYYIKIK
jgi:hypothetical protein